MTRRPSDQPRLPFGGAEAETAVPDGGVTDARPPSPPSPRSEIATPTEITIFCDGGSRGNPGPAAVGAVVLDSGANPPRRLASVSECIGVTTNNVAEYQALIAGLEAAAPFGAPVVRVRADSLLMIRQLRGEYRVRQPHLQPLFRRVRQLLDAYATVDLQHVRREENVEADALVNRALDGATR